jgi:DNA-binding XRE family transcriptional regulator
MGKASDEPIGVRFGHSLLEVRRRIGLSQGRLAGGAGLHRTEIGVLENGQRAPRIDTLVSPANAPTISPMTLLEGIA